MSLDVSSKIFVTLP